MHFEIASRGAKYNAEIQWTGRSQNRKLYNIQNKNNREIYQNDS